MPNVRAVHTKSEHNLSKHEFYAAYHYALQYSEWKDRCDSLIGLRAVSIDGQPHGGKIGNPTEQQGLSIYEWQSKMKVIEDTVREAAPDIYQWMLKAVTHEGVTFAYLSTVMEIPCGKKYYYSRRRKFYYLLAQKLFGTTQEG